MANNVNSNYQLETSYFSFWQVMGFNQTAAFSDWTLDTKTGYTGRVSFNVPAGQKCLAYVHAGNDVIRLAELSYTSL
jgi:hypothetical protein